MPPQDAAVVIVYVPQVPLLQLPEQFTGGRAGTVQLLAPLPDVKQGSGHGEQYEFMAPLE